MHHCIIHIDGGARGNPGPAGAGVVIVDAEDSAPIHEAGYFLGRATNNVAEYHGLLRALELAGALGAHRLTLHSDSQLLVRQLNGEYRVKSADLKPLFQQAETLLRGFATWEIDHVRRQQNQRADALANAAMDAGRDVIETDGRAFMQTAPRRAATDAGKKSGKKSGKRTTDPAAPAASREPRWTLTLRDGTGRCEAGQAVGKPFTFGATTPANCCVHAAAAALRDGPLQWPGPQHEGETRCERCGGRITLHRTP